MAKLKILRGLFLYLPIFLLVVLLINKILWIQQHLQNSGEKYDYTNEKEQGLLPLKLIDKDSQKQAQNEMDKLKAVAVRDDDDDDEPMTLVDKQKSKSAPCSCSMTVVIILCNDDKVHNQNENINPNSKPNSPAQKNKESSSKKGKDKMMAQMVKREITWDKSKITGQQTAGAEETNWIEKKYNVLAKNHQHHPNLLFSNNNNKRTILQIAEAGKVKTATTKMTSSKAVNLQNFLQGPLSSPGSIPVPYDPSKNLVPKSKQESRQKKNKKQKLTARDFDRQINQTIVLLKSIVLQQYYGQSRYYSSSAPGQSQLQIDCSCVNVLVVSDSIDNFLKIQRAIYKAEKWSQDFTNLLNLTHIPAQYPPGSQWMRKLFRPCATLRLFLADFLPKHVDSIIYLDTDIILLRNLHKLWAEFGRFPSGKTVGALAPCLYHYGSDMDNGVPYFGKTGLNAGIMLMNLTRMRESRWTHKIRMVTSAFQHQIKLADQDILNIYFHSNPEEVHELTCDWNFRPFQCRPGSFCRDPALTDGISALHGNALSFSNSGPEPLFRSIFSAFQQQQLKQLSPKDVSKKEELKSTSNSAFRNMSSILDQLLDTLERNFEDPLKIQSDCARLRNFKSLSLSRLKKLKSQYKRFNVDVKSFDNK